jgi:hypothetical protein
LTLAKPVTSSGSKSDFPEMSAIEDTTEGRKKRYFTIFFDIFLDFCILQIVG